VKLAGQSTARRNRFRRPPPGAGRSRRPLLGPLARAAGLTSLVAGLALGFVLLHDLATQCRTFAASRIQVRGNRHLDEMAVIRQAGLHPQVNVLAVRLGPCRRRLLAHPWIAAASVKRRLPDRIEIAIAEHRPLAVAEMPKGRLLIDDKGHPFKMWASQDPDHLPVIQGLSYGDLPLGGAPPPRIYAAALEAVRRWRAFHGDSTAAAPFTILADRDAGLAVEAGAGLGLVILGFDQYAEKLANLNRLMQRSQLLGGADGWRRIDLTQRQRIVVLPQGDPKES
jgi:hypothetical protein